MKNLLYYINIEKKEEKLMKKFIKIAAVIIGIIAIITSSVIISKERFEAENLKRQNQITQVANVEEETIFETKSQDEANQLIAEIQKHNKRIVKIEFFKDQENYKQAKAVLRITYNK